MTTLANGFYDVPPGKVATVVTHLEMRTKAAPRPSELPDGWVIERVETPDLNWFRTLFRKVGEDYLWFSRLKLDDAALTAELTHPEIELFTLRNGDDFGGLLELTYREMPRCEVAFFGVIPELVGTTAARCLMNFAIERAWSRPIDHLYLHTCTLDSPKALAFYRRSGFVPTRYEIEIDDDPRLVGMHPEEAGAHIPLIRPAS